MSGDAKTKIEEIEFLELFESDFSGCPVCHLNHEAVHRSVFGILYEMVNDPGVRSRLRENGLCVEHAKTISRVLEESPDLGLLGISIILKDMLDHNTTLTIPNSKRRTRRDKRVRSRGCYFCELEAEANNRHVSTFAKMMRERHKRKAFERSETTLCLRHTVEVAELLAGSPDLEDFMRIQREKLRILSSHLDSFIAKHDYRNTIPLTSQEASAWKKALEIVSGGIVFDG